MHNLFRVKRSSVLRKSTAGQSKRVKIGRAAAAHNDAAGVATDEHAMLATDVVKSDNVGKIGPSTCNENPCGVCVLTNKTQTGPGRHASHLTRFVHKYISDRSANSNHQAQLILMGICNNADCKRLGRTGALGRLNRVRVVGNEHASADA
jgi:hypothetical protein